MAETQTPERKRAIAGLSEYDLHVARLWDERRWALEERWPRGMRVRIVGGAFYVGESGVITHNRVTEHDSGAFVRLDSGKGTVLMHWTYLAPIADVEG